MATIPHFDGQTYSPSLDHGRLSSQLVAVRDFLLSHRGFFHTLSEIKHHVELELRKPVSEASISARLRDLRKARFGGFDVERRRGELSGTWYYRIAPEVSQ